MSEIIEASFYSPKNQNTMFTNFSFIKVLGWSVVIFCLGLIVTSIVVGEPANATAQKLANAKIQEVQAEVQIQQWQATKTAATKEILRLNGELAKEAQAMGKIQATSK